jgi:endonuclease/exonuclease/phosphatase family metal-dependent hydrolase
VGLLFDRKRVQARQVRTYAEINPHGEPCKDSLRPGHGAHLTFPGGLSLHVVSLHLKSGTERRSLDLRQRSVQSLSKVYQLAQAQLPDPDVVFAGDWNTMGCARCSPKLSGAEEIAELSRSLEILDPRLTLVQGHGCSHFYRGRPGLLDHFAVSPSLGAAVASVSGYCGVRDCKAFETDPEAYHAISDHCPVVLELADRASEIASP